MAKNDDKKEAPQAKTQKSEAKAAAGAKKREANERRDANALRPADFKNSRSIPYHKITITCACGGEFEAGSILESIRVDICSSCHPFFTGENKIVDAEGRVDKFRKRYNLSAAK
jgi:large subunit ribosomal protein L31